MWHIDTVLTVVYFRRYETERQTLAENRAFPLRLNAMQA